MRTVPDVVVSVVNTSNCALLARCLETLFDDPGRRSTVEIAVLDNASTDGSVEMTRTRFPQVRLIAQTYRAGFGANHNVVIRGSRSRYVFVLNEDTEMRHGTIDALVDYLDAHPECAVVGPRIVGPDGRQQGSAWRLMSLSVQLTWALSLGQLGAVVSRGDDAKPVGAVSACAMLVRRDAFERIGAFDERYFIFSEEADSAQRLARLGYEVHYLQAVTVVHHGQQSTSGLPTRQINEHWRSLRLYTRQWHCPFEARVLELLTGIGYGLAFVVAQVVLRLPGPIRPPASRSWNPAIYALHVRRAFGRGSGPGLREAAEDFNRDRERSRPPTTEADSS